MRRLVLGIALISANALAQIDPTILTGGNTWSYRQVVMEGPTDLRLVFEGVSFVKLDTVFGRSDTLFLSVTSKDSSFEDSIHYYEIDYALADGNIVELDVKGGRPQYLKSDWPLFLIGSGMDGSLSYVRYDGKMRIHSHRRQSPVATYGETTDITYLQGIGLIGYSYDLIGPLARGRRSLQLLESNGKAFDSTEIELFGNVTHLKSMRGKPRASENALRFHSGERRFLLNGRRF